jgi:hypothetical protein
VYFARPRLLSRVGLGSRYAGFDVRDARSRNQGWHLMRWSTFQYKGQVYDLAHLDQFDHIFVISEAGSYPITIRFSHHCFTEHSSLTDDPDLFFTVGKEQRTFDLVRWQFSQRLPEIIKTLEARFISHTDHQSFFTIELIDDQGRSRDYEVYFEVTRDNKTKRLYLTVKSAYLRDQDRIGDRPKSRKIRLAVILRNVQQNKPIRTQ